MTDPVQLLIDAGAIPSTPFVPQSRYSGVPLAVLQRRARASRAWCTCAAASSRAPEHLTIAGRHVVTATDRPDPLRRNISATRCCTGASPTPTRWSIRTS